MKKLGRIVGILFSLATFVASLVIFLDTEKEWILRLGVAIGIVLACVGIFAVLRDRTVSEAPQSPAPAQPSTFGKGDFSGSTIEGNQSSAEQFLDGIGRDATIRNNTHNPKQP